MDPQSLPTREELLRKALFVPCKTKADLHRWIKVYLGFDIPDGWIDPGSNSSPMDMIWEVYDAALNNRPGYSQILAYAARDSFKTFAAAILEVLSIVHLGRSVAHMAAIESQAKKSQQYLKKHFSRPFLKEYVTLKNERMVEITRYYNSQTGESITLKEYEAIENPAEQMQYEEIKHYVTVIICTIAGANSEHVPVLVVDEVDVVENPDAYQESKMIPAPMNGKLPITLYTSTRKYSFGLVQKDLIDNQDSTGIVIRHWNLLDVAHPCHASRCRPDLPKLKVYSSDDTLLTISESDYTLLTEAEKAKYHPAEAYGGCVQNCRLFAVCKGRLAEKPKCTRCANDGSVCPSLLKPVEHVQSMFKRVPMDKAKAQLLCWKPSAEGLIYPNFSREVHMLTAAQMAEKITGDPHPPTFSKLDLIKLMKARGLDFVSGLDHGFIHNFVVVSAAVDGNKAYVFDVISQAELELPQKLEIMEERLKGENGWDPIIFADTENPSDNKTMKKKGFRLRDWSKAKDSVRGGISIVRMKLMPTFGKPDEAQLFYLKGDEGCELLATRTSQYHFTTDAAGRITDVPDEEDDDEMDGLRYLIMNRFAPKGKIMADSAPLTPTPQAPADRQYTAENWMGKIIAEQTGGAVTPGPISDEIESGRGHKNQFIWDLG